MRRLLKSWMGKSAAPARAPPAVLKPYYIADDRPRARALRAALMIGFCLMLPIYGFYYALTTPWMLVQFLMPLGVLMVICIWALPDGKAAPTRAMERLFFAFVICIAWPNYLAIAPPGLPWITLLRLTGFPMVLCLLISISVSADFRGQLREVMRASPLLWRGVTIFAVLMLLSVGLSKDPMFSLQKLIVGQVNWIGIFFISMFIFRKPGRPQAWMYAQWILVLTIAVIALYEARVQHVVWASHLPPFLKINDPIIEKLLTGAMRRATDEYRVKATFTTPLGLAEYMALCLPFILHLMFGPYRFLVRLAAVPTFFIAFTVIIVTGSRLGMVGALIGMLLYTLIWAYLRWRTKRLGIIAPALLVAYPAIAGLVLVASLFVTRLRRMVWGGGATAASDATRALQVEQGIPKIFKNPFGYGIGQGAEVVGVRGGGGVLTLDNYYIMVAIEYGILGFIVYYGTIVVAIVYSAKTMAKLPKDREVSLLIPLAISLTSFFVIKWVFSQQENHPIIFAMLGMIAALVYRANKAERDSADSEPTAA